MFFSPFANIGLEGALHKSLLKLLIHPFKGHSGMGGKGKGWAEGGSNRPNTLFLPLWLLGVSRLICG